VNDDVIGTVRSVDVTDDGATVTFEPNHRLRAALEATSWETAYERVRVVDLDDVLAILDGEDPS
jgi:hypothetical protein